MSKTPKAIFVNPTRITTQTAFVMPAAQVTLAGAIPAKLNVRPVVVDEAIQRFDPSRVEPNDVVFISALTNNVREAYRIVRQTKERGATAIVGGPHATLVPEEALRYGADAVFRGEGDTMVGQIIEDAAMNRIPASKVYQTPDGNPFQVAGYDMAYPRLDLVDLSQYWTASLRSTAGCREHCTFCTVPTIGGRVPRERPVEMVAREVRELHQRGIRFVLWGADNLVQIPLSLIETARDLAERKTLEAERERSLKFFRQFGKLTGELKCWGFAQLTLRLHDDPEMLTALNRDAGICAALFGIESIDPEALRLMAKQWNGTAAEMIGRIRRIEQHNIHVLGSMIVGLPTDTPETIAAMRQFSIASGMSVAQYPIFEILPGSPDYTRAKRDLATRLQRDQPHEKFRIATNNAKLEVRLLRDRYWLESEDALPHLHHPTFTFEQLREEGQKSWKYFYRVSHLVQNGIRSGWPLRRTLTYVIACKGFARFYGGSVGLSADSVRTGNASFFQRKLMALGARLMHTIPPPKQSQ